jgi:acetyl-CoA carboxylase carboxyltransferase component
MVGEAAERGGIAKDGAKMVTSFVLFLILGCAR